MHVIDTSQLFDQFSNKREIISFINHINIFIKAELFNYSNNQSASFLDKETGGATGVKVEKKTGSGFPKMLWEIIEMLLRTVH